MIWSMKRGLRGQKSCFHFFFIELQILFDMVKTKKSLLVLKSPQKYTERRVKIQKKHIMFLLF
jgi:hypothetical protein